MTHCLETHITSMCSIVVYFILSRTMLTPFLLGCLHTIQRPCDSELVRHSLLSISNVGRRHPARVNFYAIWSRSNIRVKCKNCWEVARVEEIVSVEYRSCFYVEISRKLARLDLAKILRKLF